MKQFVVAFMILLGVVAPAHGAGKNPLWDILRQIAVGVAVDITTDAVREEISGPKKETHIQKLNALREELRKAEERGTYPSKADLQRMKILLDELNRFVKRAEGGIESIDQSLGNIRSTEGWFVILGSYTKSQFEHAYARRRRLQALGYVGTYVADTDQYPNLQNGLFIVTLGPLRKSDAQRLKEQLTQYVPDAYIKSGW